MLYGGTFRLRIITPTRVVFDEDVLGVRAPGSLSPFEVLAGHASFVSSLDVGEVRLTRGSSSNPTRDYMAIGGGVLEVSRTGVTLLADTAERANEIEVPRAEQARDRALQRVRHPTRDTDVQRAEAALARALNRLAVRRHVA